MVEGLSDKDLVTVPELIGVIESRGIGLNLTRNNWPSILTAASAGKREPPETAA